MSVIIFFPNSLLFATCVEHLLPRFKRGKARKYTFFAVFIPIQIPQEGSRHEALHPGEELERVVEKKPTTPTSKQLLKPKTKHIHHHPPKKKKAPPQHNSKQQKSVWRKTRRLSSRCVNNLLLGVGKYI